MQFRDRGQRDDRRRRVLGEEHRSAAVSVATSKRRADTAAAADVQETDAKARYAQAALPQNQRPITDLIPTRWTMVALLVLIGTLAIAAVEGAHYYLPQVLSEVVGRAYAAELTAWLGSTFAVMAAGMSLLVYAVRRHKVDDYNGRYRIWLWAAACWMLLGASAVVGLDELGRLLLVQATGWTGPANGAVWAIAPLGSIVLVMGIRLILDMRESRLSTGVFVSAGVVATASIVMKNDWIVIADPRTATMVQSGLSMVAYLLLLVSTSLHGRHIVRDAQGLVPVRPAKPAKAKKKKTEAAEDVSSRKSDSKSDVETDSTGRKSIAIAKPKQAEKVRTDLKVQPAGRAAHSKVSTANESGSDDVKLASSPAEDKPTRKLSKAERKRLRKQKRRALNDAA